MQMIKNFCSLFLAVFITIVKTEHYHEIPVPKDENINNQKNYEIKSIENGKERAIEEDDDDDDYDDGDGDNTGNGTNTGDGDGIDDDKEDQDVDGKYLKIIIHGTPEYRNAIRDEQRIWGNGTVPFEVSHSFQKKHRIIFFEAMDTITNNTCVCFQRRKTESVYVSVVPGDRCTSDTGKGENENTNIIYDRSSFLKIGTVLHELMHALGFFHEHNRPDRDDYININFQNIKRRHHRNFNRMSYNEVQTFDLPYDYGSVMHYSSFAFAKDRNIPTIHVFDENAEIGQRTKLSDLDVEKINRLYNCPMKTP